jgi:hypothetical protein
VKVDAESCAGTVEGELTVFGNVAALFRRVVRGGLVALLAEEFRGVREVFRAHDEIHVEKLTKGQGTVDMLGENGALKSSRLNAPPFEGAQKAGQFEGQDGVPASVGGQKAIESSEGRLRDSIFYSCEISTRQGANRVGATELEENGPVDVRRDGSGVGSRTESVEQQFEFRVCDAIRWLGHAFCIIPPGREPGNVRKTKY